MIIIQRKNKHRNRRRFWVHPLVLERRSRGLFHTLFDDLQQDDDQFFSYFRMSKNSFQELLAGISNIIRRKDIVMRHPFHPLHNFARERDGYKFEDTLCVAGLEGEMAVDNTLPGNATKSIRTAFADYFMNEEAVAWQMAMI